MRLFIAVNFADEIKTRIVKLQTQLRSQSLRGNFSRRENLHITMAFLGETPEEKIQCLFQIMEEIQSPSFDIVFSRTGCFTHSRKELWWIGAEPDCAGVPLLNSIHDQLLDHLEKEGFTVDKRPFNAHITLGREVSHKDPIILDNPVITVRVDHISLMKSENIRGVLTYTELHRRQLL